MNQQQIEAELRSAYKELRYKQDMLNYADRDFVAVVAYEIKAVELKIEALKKKLEMMKNEVEEPKENNRSFWNNYIHCITIKPIGAIMDRTSCKQCN